MKIDQPSLAIMIIGIMDIFIGFYVLNYNFAEKQKSYSKIIENTTYTDDKLVEENIENSITAITDIPSEISSNEIPEESPVVFEGMTLDELSNKLDKSLNSTLSGTGYLFASKSIELGLDPYLAVAIVLHETGCSWNCSRLVTECNNVGGQKGTPGCFGGSYRSFSTLEEGINSYLENLYNNYYALGLTTAETINPKYAESTTWASKVNYYIKLIKEK